MDRTKLELIKAIIEDRPVMFMVRIARIGEGDKENFDSHVLVRGINAALCQFETTDVVVEGIN